jgi:hypothetical protein
MGYTQKLEMEVLGEEGAAVPLFPQEIPRGHIPTVRKLFGPQVKGQWRPTNVLVCF